jgi:hypothetical protein
MDCGCYSIKGLGKNKAALFAAGGNRAMLASAMMETDTLTADYAYGDNKTWDSFNAGVCKQNWGMIRECHPEWRSLGAGDYARAAAMNTDRALDAKVYLECRAYFGERWYAGHRAGWGGLQDSNTQDIRNFTAAAKWTERMVVGHECDDLRFWVDVPAI